MKHITAILITLSIIFMSGCVALDVPLYGTFRSDPGVRVYESKDTLIINITHNPGTEPVYDPAKIIKAVKEE